MQHRTHSLTKSFIPFILSAALLACTPVIDNRGYIFDEKLIDNIEHGQTTRTEVFEIMGAPSTQTHLDAPIYYYIGSRFEKVSYHAPRETNRKVLVIYFDQNDIVRDLAHYQLADGRVITLVARTTPTRGRELTFLEQIFGNFGRFGANRGQN